MPRIRYEEPLIWYELVTELGDPLGTPVIVSELPIFLCAHGGLLAEPCDDCAAGPSEPETTTKE